jgi:alpha-glucosidase
MSTRESGPVTAHRIEDGALLLEHAAGLSRLDLIADDILRVRWAPAGVLPPPRPWEQLEPLPPHPIPQGAVRGEGSELRLQTGRLQVILDLERGLLGLCDGAGGGFAEDLAAPAVGPLDLTDPVLARHHAALGPGLQGLSLRKRLYPEEACLGLGQRMGELNRRYRRLSNWTTDAVGYHHRGRDNMYQAHPFLLMLRPGLAWGLYLHSSWHSVLDLGYRDPGVLEIATLGDVLDYFLLSGPTPAAVLEQLTRLTGRPMLPPLWALGFHQSRWGYRSAREVEEIVTGFRRRGLGLDALHLDIDYMDGYRVFTWDPQAFPDPTASIAGLHREAVRVVTIVDPGVKQEPPDRNPVLRQGLERDLFIRDAQGRLVTGHVWPGESLFPDFCREEVRGWWGECHRGLLEAGVDGIWCDMNEPAIFDRAFRTPGMQLVDMPLDCPQGEPGQGTVHAEVHNLYGLHMARAAYEGQTRLRPGHRPWVLTRSAFTGAQRWSATWMGDNASTWDHLAASLPQLAGMGLSGMPHAGVDIGGFYQHCQGELLARWLELGTFYPFMRSHTSAGTRPQEPWAFGPEVESLARIAIERRYRLLPYLYTLAHQAQRSGAPLLRPLLYDFPGEPWLYAVEDQLMVGPLLMVAPVLRPGLRRRLVELPPGVWHDFHSGARVGPGPLVQEAPLGRPPMLVRGGAILTLGNVRRSSAEPVSELTLDVYPGADGDWTLIEDDGESFDYRDGGLAETELALRQRGERLVLELGARRGRFVPAPRRLRVQVHLEGPPGEVRLDGWVVGEPSWEEGLRALVLGWPDDGAAHRLEMAAVAAPGE